MGKFRKKKEKGTPQVTTAALPDIIFMLLFFFMVSTVMRTESLLVKIKAPGATEVQKLEKKSLVSYINIGPPKQENLGSKARIQLNDSFARVSDVREFILTEREKLDEADRQFMTTALKIDQDTKMGIVTDVKQELRQVGAFKINYNTRQVAEINYY
ncbi:MAG: ExbD/TolR family protein [Bacteroidota bacterium]